MKSTEFVDIVKFYDSRQLVYIVKMESKHRKLPPNPREKSNILSLLLFGWTFSIFKKGYTKVLEFDDIYEPLKCDKSDLLGDHIEA